MNSGLVGALGAAPLRLTGMTRRVITSSPNAGVNALQLLATGGSKNVDLVITPKGAGALIAGPAPDGTVAGGNKRGVGAKDFQITRDGLSQVAAGVASFLGGGRWNVIATNGENCAIIGGERNACSGSNPAQSFIGSGQSNTVQFPNGGIVSGKSNTISSSFCGFIGGGEGNLVSADYASILGGVNARADRYGMQAHTSARFGGQGQLGDAQNARFVVINKTTTNSAVELFLDGTSVRLTVPSGKVMSGLANICGIKSDGSVVARYYRQFTIKNVAGTTSLVGSVVTVGSDEANGTSVSITANDANDALKIEVTGIASETWRWVAFVDAVEIVYGT
jgi:hypothetical protein